MKFRPRLVQPQSYLMMEQLAGPDKLLLLLLIIFYVQPPPCEHLLDFLCYLGSGRENEERPLPHFHIKYLGICAPCQCRSKSRNFKRQPLDSLSEGPTYWLIGKPIKRQDVAEQPIGNGSAGRGCIKRKWSTEGKACIEVSAQEASAGRLSRGSQEVKVQSAVSCVCLL